MLENLPAKAGDRRDARDTGLIRLIPELGRCPGGGHGNPLQYSCLENPMDRGVWRATVHGVVKSQTGLKRISTASDHFVIVTADILTQTESLCCASEFSSSPAVYFCVSLMNRNSSKAGEPLPRGSAPSGVPGKSPHPSSALSLGLGLQWPSDFPFPRYRDMSPFSQLILKGIPLSILSLFLPENIEHHLLRQLQLLQDRRSFVFKGLLFFFFCPENLS